MSASLFEIIQEGGDTFEGGLALSFDFDFKLDFGFADAANVADGMQFSDQSHTTSRHHGLSKAHLVHAIVYQHLDIVHLNNLFPQVGQQRKRKISVCDSALKLALLLGALHVNVYPLMV